MASTVNPGLIDHDAPELTDEELANARPASEGMPADIFAELSRRRPGQRGVGKRPAKVAVTLRLDPDTLAAFKAGGPGWQTRINGVLRQAARALPREPVSRRANRA